MTDPDPLDPREADDRVDHALTMFAAATGIFAAGIFVGIFIGTFWR